MCGTIDLLITHSSCVCVTWCIHMCDMTHLYTWHDSFIGVTWRDLPIWETYSFMCVTWLIHVCDHRLSSLPIALVCVIWLIHTRDKPRSYVCAVPYICDSIYIFTWLIYLTHMSSDSIDIYAVPYICDIYMWHIYVPYICDFICTFTWLIHMTPSRDSLTWLIHTGDENKYALTHMTHSHTSVEWLIHIWATYISMHSFT